MVVFLGIAFIIILASASYILADFNQRYGLGKTIELNKYATFREINKLQASLPTQFQRVTQSEANITITSGDVWSLNWLAGLQVAFGILASTPDIATAMLQDALAMTGLPTTVLLIGLLTAVIAYLVIRKAIERVVGKI